MTGRSGGRSGGPGRGGGRFSSSGRGGRSANNYNNNSNSKTGLTKELEGNIFEFGTANAADKMKTTQEKIADYVGIDMSRPLMVVTDHGQTHSMYVPYAST